MIILKIVVVVLALVAGVLIGLLIMTKASKNTEEETLRAEDERNEKLKGDKDKNER